MGISDVLLRACQDIDDYLMEGDLYRNDQGELPPDFVAVLAAMKELTAKMWTPPGDEPWTYEQVVNAWNTAWAD